MTTLNHQSEFITALKLGRNSVLLSCELPYAASVATILSASNSAAQSEVDSSVVFKKTLSNLNKSPYTFYFTLVNSELMCFNNMKMSKN